MAKTSKAALLRWAQEQMNQGIPRQAIWDQWLCLDVFEMSFEDMQAYSDAERELFAVMVDRNLTGIELEKTGRTDEAIALYEANVRDEFCGKHPYRRLAVIYTKRKDYLNAIRVCQALSDQFAKTGYTDVRLQEQIAKLSQKQSGETAEKKAARKTRTPAAKTELLTERANSEHGIPVKWIEGVKLVQGKRGKAKYQGQNGDVVTIEQFVLQTYVDNGYRGMWTENNYWWAVMALLFWDVIFARLPGVYSPEFGDFPGRQDQPLDFYTPEFYKRRMDLIEKRIHDLTQPKFFGLSEPDIANELRAAYSRHKGKPCRPMDWDRFSNVEDLVIATKVLSTEQLMAIMRRLLVDFNENRRGLPDLFLANDSSSCFVEVKAENEEIAEHQVRWMKYLQDELKLNVEICRVTAK